VRNIVRFVVREAFHDKPLPEVLVSQKELLLPSLKKARALLESGRCSLNGKIKTFANVRCNYDDRVEVVPPYEGPLADASYAVIFEDEKLLVVNKPPGALVEERAVSHALKRPSKEIFLVHRLDKETTGVLIIAKDPTTQKKLEEYFKNRLVKKEYLAIVDGEMKKKEGSINYPLEKKGQKGGELHWGICQGSRGLPSHTEYKVIKTSKDASLVALFPLTGRTHQLRLHMTAIHHPILGDYRYGEHFHSHLRPPRQLLHAFQLQFPDICSNNGILHFKAELPKDFRYSMSLCFGSDTESLWTSLL
jgi:RluA family pseudouridine synthase